MGTDIELNTIYYVIRGWLAIEEFKFKLITYLKGYLNEI